MATKYTFRFTDTTKTGFDVQSYTANGIKVPSSVVLLDRASQATTTLKLYGKGLPQYGEGVLQNMIFALENFANNSEPKFSIEGQMWYNNVGVTGSPVLGEELFIRNSNGTGGDIVNDWTAVILASGTSTMTGELLLAGTPTEANHAVPLSLVSNHTSDGAIHLTLEQNTFLDNLNIIGSPPALTSSDVNRLVGITGNVQILLDNKLSLDGGAMNVSSPVANITFVGGEVLGLPAVPSANDAAASKKYVDDQNIAGTGELTAVDFITPDAIGSPPGSPVIVIDTAKTSVLYTVTSPSTTTFLQLDGISRVGHGHTADEISLDTSFNLDYPTDVQSGFEFVDVDIQQLKTALIPDTIEIILNINRKFEILISDILVSSPISPYVVLEHNTDDNNLSITINGIKQYAHTHASQDIVFDTDFLAINANTATYIDESITYDFNISVDGAPDVLITIPSGTDLANHGSLVSTINDIMNVASPVLLGNTMYQISSTGTETFYATSSGVASLITVSDPVTANTYLFETDASPDTITGATFLSDSSQIYGSPPGSPIPTPDTIEILGDVTSSFPVGQSFIIKGSIDATYNSYDGIYSVHVTGAIASGSPLTTAIPIAIAGVPDTNMPLLLTYDPTGSPAQTPPAPSPYGEVYISPILGIDSVATPTTGVDGDYVETDAGGVSTIVGDPTSYVVFNYDILSGSKIETLKYS